MAYKINLLIDAFLFKNIFSVIYILRSTQLKYRNKIFLRHKAVRRSRHRDHGGQRPTSHAYVSMGCPSMVPTSSIYYGQGAFTLLWLYSTYSWWESHVANFRFHVTFLQSIFLDFWMISSNTRLNAYINNNYFRFFLNQISSTNDPPIRLNVLLDKRTVLIRLPYNVGSGMMPSCRGFGQV